MRQSHLFLIAGVAVLSVAMFALNLKLYKVNAQVKSQLDRQIEMETRANSPSLGWAMPILHGKRIDGTDPAVDLQGSAPKMTLFVFDTSNCPACEQNWKFWDQLLADGDISHSFISVTTGSIPDDFLNQHPLVRKHMLITNLDPNVAKPMHLQAAPQTIYMESGTVKKVWFGLLSDQDVQEISKDMQTED